MLSKQEVEASPSGALLPRFKACLGQVSAKQAGINRHFLPNEANTVSTSQVEQLLLVYREPTDFFAHHIYSYLAEFIY